MPFERLRPFLLALPAWLGLSGCAGLFAPAMTDLRADLVEIVDRRDPNERRLKYWEGSGPYLYPGTRVAAAVLVRLSSRIEPASIARVYQFSNFFSEISFCPEGQFPPTSNGQSIGYVHYDGGLVGPTVTQTPDPDGLFRVYISIPVRAYLTSRDRNAPRPGPVDYDLRQNPRDICVRLRGNQMTGLRWSSNPAVIPASAIRQAIDAYPGW